MKRKKSKPFPASQVDTSFPISDICGMWKSLCGSPDIEIYYDGSRFRLQFSYKQDTAFTVPLSQCWGITFFNFYGIIRIAYDDERDMLSLTNEGEYKRVYNEV
ncbi:MAG: DUF3876 domain-containing protein [Tannerellaceae bacterium]|jgi:hypothetical protein|nr:DUF3876 domain-containing protein [Tannerellaceae bacterium]